LTFVTPRRLTAAEVEDAETARTVFRFQCGDENAFGELYLRYFDRVYGYLMVALRDPHGAEDLTQQVFTRVLEALPGYEHRKPFRAWLFAIVRNHAIDELKKRASVKLGASCLSGASGPQVGNDAVAVLSGWRTDRELTLLMERLPLAQQQVLFLRFVMDLSHEQVAEVLGRSPEQVRAL